MTTEQRLAEIADRAEKATPGVWENEPRDFGSFGIEKASITAGWRASSNASRCVSEEQAEANGEFIAAARQDIPWLLELVREQREALQRVAAFAAYADMPKRLNTDTLVQLEVQLAECFKASKQALAFEPKETK